ncbi:MAG: BON domain-containing protein [Pyrinomonadaceae bacterium]
MKSYRRYLTLLFALFAFSILSVNAQSYSDTKSGRTIEQNVRRQILKLPRYEVFDYIGYTVDGSTVTLYGKVRNAINKSGAENNVEDIPGVTRVVNNIEVLPLGGLDESIRARLYRSLSNSGGLSRYLWTVNPSVRLIVDRGHVTLEGYVSNKGDYNRMNIVANGVSGVFSVTNNLKIDSDRAG